MKIIRVLIWLFFVPTFISLTYSNISYDEDGSKVSIIIEELDIKDALSGMIYSDALDRADFSVNSFLTRSLWLEVKNVDINLLSNNKIEGLVNMKLHGRADLALFDWDWDVSIAKWTTFSKVFKMENVGDDRYRLSMCFDRPSYFGITFINSIPITNTFLAEKIGCVPLGTLNGYLPHIPKDLMEGEPTISTDGGEITLSYSVKKVESKREKKVKTLIPIISGLLL